MRKPATCRASDESLNRQAVEVVEASIALLALSPRMAVMVELDSGQVLTMSGGTTLWYDLTGFAGAGVSRLVMLM